MSKFFFLIVGLATFHFVYEGMIAPSLLMVLKFRVFRLRDRLRMLAAGPTPSIAPEDFKLHQESINNVINLLPYITPIVMYKAKKTLENKKLLLERSKKRVERLEKCSCEEAVHIYHEANRSLLAALGVNAGGWLLYVLPLVLGILLINEIKGYIQDLITLPGSDLEQFSYEMRSLQPRARHA